MRMEELQAILDGERGPELRGYIIRFWWNHGTILGKERPEAGVVSDSFPDYEAGESPFELEAAKDYCQQLVKKLGDQISPEVRALYFSSVEGFTTKPEWKP